MSRRRPTAFDVILCIALFTLVMSALSWVLHQTVPSVTEWIASQIGAGVALTVLLIAAGLGGLWSYREHRRQGSARRR